MRFIFPLVVAALARAAITAPAQPEYANIMARASIGRFEDNSRQDQHSLSNSRLDEGLGKIAKAASTHDAHSNPINTGASRREQEASPADQLVWGRFTAGNIARKSRGRALVGGLAIQARHRAQKRFSIPPKETEEATGERVYRPNPTAGQNPRRTQGRVPMHRTMDQQYESLRRGPYAGHQRDAQTSREQDDRQSRPQKRGSTTAPQPFGFGDLQMSRSQFERGAAVVADINKQWEKETRPMENARLAQMAAQEKADCEKEARRRAKKDRFGRAFRACMGKKDRRPREQSHPNV
ncbi:hypothetical protein MCOR03_000398 [Pyricularia oryzae]|nr:hypothetical protein MCOR30_003971 [Pyricularia oryzae]KAI6463753.1 hypothetical protein MCOR15_004037 [Pyricularia oryzae]KAI6532746.1 hypothetical protein MCOR16_003782 [Pyricularia oryzae]KAI6568566.1 hypothetical protein MCOR03_000398 [Pyricularia oryzae]KAI6573219.1 hypothetical protein MCOR09_003002 [Pyricularia oryzae]